MDNVISESCGLKRYVVAVVVDFFDRFEVQNRCSDIKVVKIVVVLSRIGTCVVGSHIVEHNYLNRKIVCLPGTRVFHPVVAHDFFYHTMKIQRLPPLLLPPVAPSSAPLHSERSAAAAHPAPSARPASPPGSSSPPVTPWHRSQIINHRSQETNFSYGRTRTKVGGEACRNLNQEKKTYLAGSTMAGAGSAMAGELARGWGSPGGRRGAGGARRRWGEREREECRRERGASGRERCAAASESREEGASPRVRCFQLESGVGPTLRGTVKNRVPPALKTHGCALAFLNNKYTNIFYI